MDKEIRTTTAKVWVDDQGILHIEATGAPSTDATVEETFTAIAAMLDGRRVPILFDARRWPSSSPAGWVQFIKRVGDVCAAGAVLIDPDHPPSLGQYPDFVSRLLIPFGVFESEDESLEFLARHLK